MPDFRNDSNMTKGINHLFLSNTGGRLTRDAHRPVSVGQLLASPLHYIFTNVGACGKITTWITRRD